ncbi:NO-binding membrane sensor protein with MHYT domain [Kineosphaera limosa]|uniref:Uncharacterized protein n=1 Tax=Kineosphaera limosa NBRC 100340 TaxID=1184609 RepID=K6X9U2_9MICO|nr:hypothetical protein [Kineosphaera limosa]NYD99654.1 NO-binding membrane sensor protein with MHYT domain [Kineosphaera limosa]GAB95609.1 hypothetical protein KILIM_024_00190 [Kineosphaera limosa NBRC 100340]
MLELFGKDILQVLLAGILVGAGVPAVFAFGMRALAYADGEGPDGAHHRLGKPAAAVCFALVVAIIALGITIIVASGLGYHVSVERGYPTILR